MALARLTPFPERVSLFLSIYGPSNDLLILFRQFHPAFCCCLKCFSLC